MSEENRMAQIAYDMCVDVRYDAVANANQVTFADAGHGLASLTVALMHSLRQATINAHQAPRAQIQRQEKIFATLPTYDVTLYNGETPIKGMIFSLERGLEHCHGNIQSFVNHFAQGRALVGKMLVDYVDAYHPRKAESPKQRCRVRRDHLVNA